jgi:hypothetical protein
LNDCPRESLSTSDGPITVTATIQGSGQASDVGDVVGLTASPLPAAPAPPAGLAFPYGLLSFRIVGLDSQAVHDITITITLPVPVTKYWKLQNGAWLQVANATFTGNQIIFTLHDGQAGDEDGQANGTIVDPGAPAIIVAATHPPATRGGQSSGSSSATPNSPSEVGDRPSATSIVPAQPLALSPRFTG